ncbi:MAG: hypothetical protein JWP26_2006 [Devosia sp.]|uniref:hypothetical protein n=1 Tax=Devosia sp. TaxID=1871048 RepID=UPI0026051254|nr:hypothetical protein [Devosia sp.]MDB5587036.1 hypothetical protein [Devosia sp.]
MSRTDLDPEDDGDRPEIVHWQPVHHHPRPRVLDRGSLAFVVLAATALGALAIGVLAIGRLAVGRARVREMHIDRLTVGALKVLKP